MASARREREGDAMIDHGTWRITDEQAAAIAAAIDRLVAVDCAMREDVPTREIDPDTITAAAVRLILAFSQAHRSLEAMCAGTGGLLEIAEAKRLQLAMADRAN